MNYIDAHSHIWTKDVDHYPLAEGKEADPVDPDFSAQKLLSICRPVGVSRVVLIQSAEYGFDNRYMLDMIKLYPGTFGGVAVLDMTKPVGATMLEMKGQGVRGFRVYGWKLPDAAPRWLATEPFQEMFSVCSTSGQSVCGLIDPSAIPDLDATCAQFPHASVVVDHMARIGVDGTIRKKEVDLLCTLARHPNVRVKISAFYALGKKNPPYLDLIPMIRQLYGAFGSRRLMWASDCPYQTQAHTYAESIALVRDHCDFLVADDKDWLLGKTAEQVFF